MSKSISLTLTYGKDNLVTIAETAPGLAANYKFLHSNRANGPFVQVATTFAVGGGNVTFPLTTSAVNSFGEQEYYQVTLNNDPVYTGSLYITVPPAAPAGSAPATDLSNYYNKAEVDAKDATKTTDSTITTVGRSVLTAASASAARTAIGAGTSNLVVGTTSSTAKAGDYAPTVASLGDATTVGKALLLAADAAAVRTLTGAGTSNLVIGTTNTTAKAGDYTPAIADVTGLTAALASKGAVKTVNNIAPDGAGNVTVAAGGGASTDVSWFSERATSTCQTVPLGLATAGGTLTNGSIIAGWVINKATKTYTNARFHIVSQTTAPTDFYVGVWGMDGTLIGATNNITSVGGALNTGTFTTPLSLTAGQQVYIGISTIGGSAVSILRYSYAGGVAGTTATMLAIQPIRVSWSVTGNAATSAAPPALTGTGQNSLIPWIDLY